LAGRLPFFKERIPALTPTSPNLLGKIATYTEILAKDPRSTVFVALADTYRKIGMLDDAREIAQRGTSGMPNFSPGYAVLGRIYAQQGELGQAAVAFEKALAIEQTSLPALKGLARIRFRQSYPDQAQALLEKVLELSPEDEIAKKLLSSIGAKGGAQPKTFIENESGAAKYGAGESKDTIPAAQQAEPMATETLGDLYLAQGLLQEAAQVYRVLLASDSDNQSLREKLVRTKQQLDGPSPDEAAPASGLPSGPGGGATQGAGGEVSSIQLRSALETWLHAIELRREHVSASLANHR